MKRLLLALAVLSAGAPKAAEAPSVSWGPSQGFAAPVRPNAEMAQDILDLAFALEDGRILPMLGRFEGPVRLRVQGAAPRSLGPDLAALLERLRDEAGLDVALETPEEAAAIAVEAVPGAALAAAVPGAACFTVPDVASWEEFLARRGSPALDWAATPRRARAAVFVPADAAPQELRDCLHEELAQALGPLNDLDRLPDSAFNDDNVHGPLTGFDMLALRALNDRALAAGMTRAEVAARLPAILRRLNPAGEVARPDGDAAAGLAWLAKGRAAEPEAALAAFRAAEAALAPLPAAALHRAQAQAQIAAFALSRGDAAEVVRLTGEAAPVAEAEEDAALLATLLLMRAEAVAGAGDAEAAEALRLDAMAPARYGFGDGAEARQAELRALSPWRLAAPTVAAPASPYGESR